MSSIQFKACSVSKFRHDLGFSAPAALRASFRAQTTSSGEPTNESASQSGRSRFVRKDCKSARSSDVITANGLGLSGRKIELELLRGMVPFSIWAENRTVVQFLNDKTQAAVAKPHPVILFEFGN
jgi:hypothetical protein